MNTRVQVEHPVTEMVTGIDIIKEQIWIAFSGETALKQTDIVPRGHAIECRINAEDSNTFLPSPGLITAYHPPGGNGVRVDSSAYQDYSVVPYYDSLIGKLIVHAENRELAINKMLRALDEFVIEGIKTTVKLQKNIISSDTFKNYKYDIKWLENYFEKK